MEIYTNGTSEAGSDNFTLICNAVTSVRAYLTDFSWIGPQGILTPSDTNERINITILNFTSTEYLTVFISTLQFNPLTPFDAGTWTCSLTLNLSSIGVDLTNTTSQNVVIKSELYTVLPCTIFINSPFIYLSVPNPVVDISSTGVPMSGNQFFEYCTATFYPGIPLEYIQIKWLDENNIELDSDPHRFRVGSVYQHNETTFGRELEFDPLLITDTGNYICEVSVQTDYLYSDVSSVSVQLLVERK